MTKNRPCQCCDATPDYVVSGVMHSHDCPLAQAADCTRRIVELTTALEQNRKRRARLAILAQQCGSSLADLSKPFSMSRQGVDSELKHVARMIARDEQTASTS